MNMNLKRIFCAVATASVMGAIFLGIGSNQADADIRLLRQIPTLTPLPTHKGTLGNPRHRSIGPKLAEEFRCLALNVYFEARSESTIGQVAVAMVTLNRVRSRSFPNTVCKVVQQGGSKNRHRCQFSWYCDGKRDVPRKGKAWDKALRVAYQSLFTAQRDPTQGALWYHADYVRPKWARGMVRTTRIGKHLYYVRGR